MPEGFEKVLRFEIGREGDAASVVCHGRLVAGATEELYQKVKPLLPQVKLLLIDLGDLAYVDSMGLGVLVRMYTSCRQVGCECRLLHLGKQLRNLLKMTNLLSVLGQAEEHGINVG